MHKQITQYIFGTQKKERKKDTDGDKMGLNSFLKSPKKEEQQVPDSNIVSHFNDIKNIADKEVDIMDDLERILGISGDEEKLTKTNINVGQLNWEFTDIWDEFRNGEEYQEEEEEEEEDERDMKLFDKEITKCFFEEEGYYNSSNGIINVKKEHVGFWDDDYRRVSLNLNLNYQEVLDAWSDRGSLWADDYSLSMSTNGCNYMGEVPVMEVEKTRREASVLRYKEKRQTRLFSKKIRYQVRKLNADKRPRLKGRFVKRVS